MKKFFIFIFIFLFILISFYVFSESLWDDRAADIYNRKVYYNVGDPIQIIINEKSSLDYRSSAKYLKSYQMNVTGGEMSGLVGFVPTANVDESKNGQERDNLIIQNTIQARITNIAGNYVTIQGVKRININNKTNTVSVFGRAYLSDIVGNIIYSDKLINPTFRITTLLDNDSEVLTEKDLIREVLDSTSAENKTEITKLSDEKKREMLLRYFNKILNVIF